jgi:hypothetical protein
MPKYLARFFFNFFPVFLLLEPEPDLHSRMHHTVINHFFYGLVILRN